MNESEDPILYGWLLICRQLMFCHPRLGMFHLGIRLGFDVFKTGWNIIHFSLDKEAEDSGCCYIQIPENPKEMLGYFSQKKPNSLCGELNHIYEDDIPQIHNTFPFRILQELSNSLIKENYDEYSPKKISSIVKKIEFISTEVSLQGYSAAFEERLNNIYLHVESITNLALYSIEHTNISVLLEKLFSPIYDLIRLYIDFELPGNQASSLLIQTLFSIIGFTTSLSIYQEELKIDCCDHLAEVACNLMNKKNHLSDDDFNLASIYEDIYISCLYGMAAMSGYKSLLANKTIRKNNREVVARKLQFLDEKLAHEAFPSLTMAVIPFMEPIQLLKLKSSRESKLSLVDFGIPKISHEIYQHSANLEIVNITQALSKSPPFSSKLNRHVKDYFAAVIAGKMIGNWIT